MYSYETSLRVRYAETDQMQYVYYGNYPMYYEVARVEAFRNLGYPYKRLEEEGIMMPVIDMNIRYIMPARYDDLLKLKVSIPELPKARIIFEYEISNEEEALINAGSTTLVFVDKLSMRPRRCPAALLESFKKYYQD